MTGHHPLLLYDNRLAVLHPAAVEAIVIDAIQIIVIMTIVAIVVVVVVIAPAARAIIIDAAALLNPDRAAEAIIAAAYGEEKEGEMALAAVEVVVVGC